MPVLEAMSFPNRLAIRFIPDKPVFPTVEAGSEPSFIFTALPVDEERFCQQGGAF
jgi:hypothetical protein